MFNPDSEQHLDDGCNCYLTPHPSNSDPPVEDINPTVQAYGERLRATTERVRLAQDWAQELWRKGFRERCLWYNVLAIYEPPEWDPGHYIWTEVRSNIG